MIAAVTVWVALRILAIGLMGMLIGSLGVYYHRLLRRPYHQQPMFWGGLSALGFVIVAMFSEIGHVGEGMTWKLGVIDVAIITGLYALYLGARHHYRGEVNTHD